LSADILEALTNELVKPGVVVVSGSLPDDVSDEVFLDLIYEIKRRGHIIGVDSSGRGLQVAVRAAVDFVKPNLRELTELAGANLTSEGAIVAAAKALRSEGIQTVIVSMGDRGAMLLAGSTPLVIRTSSSVPVISRVGAGDALVGGYAYGVARGLSQDESLRIGVAAATASIRNSIPGLVEPVAFSETIEFLADSERP
jgi:fructose-1-phosphate kinase PfkB-like protein